MSRVLQLAFLQKQHMVIGMRPGIEARDLGLTLLCLYCSEKCQASPSLSVSLFPCLKSEGVELCELGRPQASCSCQGHGVGKGWWAHQLSATFLGLIFCLIAHGAHVHRELGMGFVCAQCVCTCTFRGLSPAPHLPSHGWAAHHGLCRLPVPSWEGQRLLMH